MEYPQIAAPTVSGPRPFWSVIIPTYTPTLPYLEETLRSVLDQGLPPGEMQIEIVDDGSPAFDPGRFLEDLGVAGRVQCFKSAQRGGIGANWNLGLARSVGEWVHILHQDDRVCPNFYKALEAGIREAPDVGAACTQATLVDERFGKERTRGPAPEQRGVLADWIENVVVELRIVATAMAVKRSVYEVLGGFDTRFQYALDWDMWKRVAAAYRVWYEPEPLVVHREHEGSTTRSLLHSADNMREIRRSIEHSCTALADRLDPSVGARARQTYARFGVDTALKLLRYHRDPVGALRQLREARRLTDPLTVVQLLAQQIWPRPRRSAAA